jgi:hypothetical protein
MNDLNNNYGFSFKAGASTVFDPDKLPTPIVQRLTKKTGQAQPLLLLHNQSDIFIRVCQLIIKQLEQLDAIAKEQGNAADRTKARDAYKVLVKALHEVTPNGVQRENTFTPQQQKKISKLFEDLKGIYTP